ncbi:MAG: glycosyltransferase family 2 protein [Rhodospirillales bacterium]|nr:glycosyltransferase family 2 protein [Rhodospirillales bacterium]
MSGGANQVANLSILVVVHNEEARLEDCLKRLSFADELVVVLDKCTDGSKDIAARHTGHLLEGAWELEGDRRNAGIEFCQGQWILEVDADEWVSSELAEEICRIIESGDGDIFNIPVHNYVGERLVRYGWGGNFGKNGYPGLFRKGVKFWGQERPHPHLTVTGAQGADLQSPLIHHIDDNISDMIRRFDRYTTGRAKDLADRGELGSVANMFRKIFSRFWKCYVGRKGYRENGYGIIIAILAAIYPLVSLLKATLEETERPG